MKNYKLDEDEVFLHKYPIKYKNKNNSNLIITNKNILITAETGLLKKTEKVIDKIAINSIKIYKEKIQLKIEKNTIKLQTIEKDIEFICKNIIDAKKIEKELIDIKTNTNILDRTTNRVNNIIKIARNITELVVIIKAFPPAAKRLKKFKKQILKFVNILVKK